jgi:hypothetical protein
MDVTTWYPSPLYGPQEIAPKKDNFSTWIFTIPTNALQGAAIRLQNSTYPLNAGAPALLFVK